MSKPTADVAVVGGGAMGCAAAFDLVRRGLSVTLIARNGIAADASGKAWGGLTAHFGAGVPGGMERVYRDATHKHKEHHARYSAELPASMDWQHHAVAAMTLALDDTELAPLAAEAQWKADNGFVAEMLDGDEVRRREPAVIADVRGAMWTDTGWELDSERYVRALMHLALRDGLELMEREVVGIAESSSSGVDVVLADGDAVSAGRVVLATGPWAGGIVGVPTLPVRPVKGEILRMRMPGDDLRVRVGYGGCNAGRKLYGEVWLGTYEQDHGYDDTPTDAGRRLIWDGVARYIPAIADAELVLQTACLRPATPDGLPLLGALTDGVLVANGGGKKGILLSLLMAEQLADLITNGIELDESWSPHRLFELRKKAKDDGKR